MLGFDHFHFIFNNKRQRTGQYVFQMGSEFVDDLLHGLERNFWSLIYFVWGVEEIMMLEAKGIGDQV